VSDNETLPPFRAEEQVALEAIVERLVTEQAVPGAVAGVWIAGHGAWTYAHGIGDLRTAAPIAVDGHFRIATVSKTFVATVVLQPVDEGALSLEDTLEQYRTRSR
jgi:D-alanyl-D-alanine carboxypeptidase